jgi:hypothetical protein
LFPEAR